MSSIKDNKCSFSIANMTGKLVPPPFDKCLFENSGDKRIVLKPTY
jgi:hypothetical protein